MDPKIERYYQALNLPPTASPEEVYKAYRDLARVWDPARFSTQPHLELMAETKLKEIIEAYHALAPAGQAEPAPQAPEVLDLLTPVPDHVVDKNVPVPVFTPDPPIAPDPGVKLEEPPAEPLPLRPWEMARPASYPKPEDAITPAIQFVPPPPPPKRGIGDFVLKFGVFAVPVLLVLIGLYMYDSSPPRSERASQPLPKATVPAKSPAPASDHEAAHRGPKKASPTSAEPAEAPISLPNGTQLMAPLGPKGAGRFRIANRSGQDAVVRVALQSAPARPLRAVYVQTDTEVPIEGIPTGVYVVYISLGPMTKAPRKFGAPLGPFQFMQIESVDGPQSDDYQIVLKPTQ